MPDERTQSKDDRGPRGLPSAGELSARDELRARVERVLALIRPAVGEDGGRCHAFALDPMVFAVVADRKVGAKAVIEAAMRVVPGVPEGGSRGGER